MTEEFQTLKKDINDVHAAIEKKNIDDDKWKREVEHRQKESSVEISRHLEAFQQESKSTQGALAEVLKAQQQEIKRRGIQEDRDEKRAQQVQDMLTQIYKMQVTNQQQVSSGQMSQHDQADATASQEVVAHETEVEEQLTQLPPQLTRR